MRPDRVLKFVCAFCDRPTDSRVLDARVTGHDVVTIRRRRRCVECLGTFPTVEVLVPRRRPPMHRPAGTKSGQGLTRPAHLTHGKRNAARAGNSKPRP